MEKPSLRWGICTAMGVVSSRAMSSPSSGISALRIKMKSGQKRPLRNCGIKSSVFKVRKMGDVVMAGVPLGDVRNNVDQLMVEEWIDMIRNNAEVLELVPKSLKTPELCRIAMKDGWALEFVPESLKNARI